MNRGLSISCGAVTLRLQAAKDCHCERSEAISPLWGLLSRETRDFTPRNDKFTPRLTEGLRGARGRLWALFIMAAVLCWLGVGSAVADSFEDSPPVWEPLLWGGKPIIANESDSPDAPSPQSLPVGPRSQPSATINPDMNRPAELNTPAPDVSGRSRPSDSSGIVPPSEPVFVGLKDRLLARLPDNNLEPIYCRAPYKAVWLKNIPPLYRAPELPGEGIWQSQGMPVGPDGQPLMYRTSYRPSAEHANAIVHMLLFDMKHVSMSLFIGSSEPGGSERTSTVRREDRPNLVAVTNALWKQKHSGEGGTIFRGQVIKKLAPGLATIVSYKDGSVDIL